MSENKKLTHNVILITFTNFIRFLANVAVTLIIPSVLSKADYGYYKTYTLYITYLVVFSFGLIEGIYLKYGGKEYDELDRAKFRCFTRFLFFLELAITAIAFLITFFLLDGNTRYVFMFLAINILSIQFTTYFQRISQITSRFSKQGIFDILYSIFILVLVGIVYFCKIESFIKYLTMITIMNYLLLIWYIVNYVDIIKGKADKIRYEKSDILYLMKLGIPLTIANFASEFILNMDRQVVNVFFTSEEYATYAFAYNFLNVINVLISAISLVLYPFLKKVDMNELKKSYSDANSLMLVIVYACLMAYYPLVKIIDWIIPKYNDSIHILKIIFPIIVFTSSISVIKHNFYKALEKNNVYFYKSIFTLILSLVSNIVVYYIFKSMAAISVASIATMLIWYLDTERYFVKNYGASFLKNLIYLLVMLGVYYLSVFLIPNIYIAFTIYTILFVIFTYFIFGKLLINVIKNYRKKDDKLESKVK